MSYTNTINTSLIGQWAAQRLSWDQAREELVRLGYDDAAIESHIKAYRKHVYGRRQNAAFLYLGGGALLGFISCLLSIANPIPALYVFILYGLTSIAIGLAFYGLYLLLN